MANIKLNNGRLLGDFLRPYVVAELNTSHFGKIEVAKEMVEKAKEVGCDCVKFQSWTVDTLYGRGFYRENKIAERFVKKFSLSAEQLAILARHAREVGIDFASTPYSIDEAKFLLDDCSVPFIKIASMELNNIPFLEELASLKSALVLSTGMGELEEIISAVDVIRRYDVPLVVLHCTSIYPASAPLLNLQNIVGLREALPDVPIGFSDHSLGSVAPSAASALGICLLEKHFTLDKTQIGMDNQMACEPSEMSEVVDACAFVFEANGSKNRSIGEGETDQRSKMRRSLVAKNSLRVGDRITIDNTEFKRPGTGIPPDKAQGYFDLKIVRDIGVGELIMHEDLE